MKKKILAVTGIRSEYDIISPVIKHLHNLKEYDVGVIACGAHLSEWHNNTIKNIEQDGFKIVERIDNLFQTNRVTQRSKGAGILTYAISQTVEREKPDYLFYVGDREEGIATAIVGNYMNVLFAHFNGGDPVYGNADDPIRFAISKLAHIHFTFTNEYSHNLESIGEEEFRIFNIGNPTFDKIKDIPVLSELQLSEYIGLKIEKEKFLILLKHPLSSEKDQAYDQMSITLKAISKIANEKNINVIGIYPNTDPGSYDMIKVIDEYQNSSKIKFFRNLPTDILINLLRNTLCLIGNSSMGLLESPFYKIPVVNIGNRQRGRLNAGNVQFVDYNLDNIENEILKACFDPVYRLKIQHIKNHFGDGYSSLRVEEILSSINLLDKRWYVKNKLC